MIPQFQVGMGYAYIRVKQINKKGSRNMDHNKLVHALFEYDQKESKKKYYNPHAMAIYLLALDEAESEVKQGETVRQAILNHFCGSKILNILFKAIGQEKATELESR